MALIVQQRLKARLRLYSQALISLCLVVVSPASSWAGTWISPAGAPPGPNPYAVALGDACATYGCGCSGIKMCKITGFRFGYNASGELSAAILDGEAANTAYRGGYASLQCANGEKRTATGCTAAPIPDVGGPICGNPIEAKTGKKIQEFVDFETAGPDSLKLTRTFSSKSQRYAAPVIERFGRNWRTNFDGAALDLGPRIHLTAPDGNEYTFVRASGIYYLSYFDHSASTWKRPIKGRVASLVKLASTFELTDRAGNVYAYDFSGRLTEIRWVGGYGVTLSYNASGRNDVVTDSHGRTLTFTYNAEGRVSSVLLPDGSNIFYEYKELVDVTALFRAYVPTAPVITNHPSWAVEYVIFPDATPAAHADNPRVRYHYEDTNDPELLTGITDERTVRFATWVFDATGRATSSTHAGGADTTTFSYNPSLNQTTVTNALGRDTVFTFGHLSQGQRYITDVDGQVTPNCPASNSQLAYDANDFVSQVTDEEGRVTKYTNDARGRPTQIIEAFGTPLARTTSYTWHATFNLPTQIVAPNLTTTNTYDATGRVTQKTLTDTTSHSVPYSTNGQARTWTYTYNAAGLLEVLDGPVPGSSDSYDYNYDASGYVTQLTNGLGHVTDIVLVNGRGQPTEILDPNGVTTEIAYDPRGRITEITVDPGANEAVTAFEYDAAGNITKVTRPNGAYLTYTYDDARRATRIENNLGEKIEFAYNAAGLVTQTDVKASGGTIIQTQSAVYDEMGRLLKTIGAASQETVYAYDKIGNETGITDPRSNVYGYTFDALNRLIRETDPDSFQTNVAYTANDNVASVADARMLTTSYVRNGFGEAIRVSSPDTGVTDYWYSAAGNVTKRIDARSIQTDMTWDGLGRITSMTFPSQPALDRTYTYDSVSGGNKGIGRLTSVADGSGSTAYVYDAQGRIISVTQVIGSQTYVTGYTYSVADDVASVSYPSGRVVTYSRDSLGRVSGVVSRPTALGADVTVASGLSWRAFGGLAGLTYGNGATLTYAYDADGRLTDMEVTGTSPIQDLTIAYDAASNITSITDNLAASRDQTFGYDDLNRVDAATGAYGALTFGYDGVGNRTGMSESLPTPANDTFAYDAVSNRLLTVTRGSAVRTMTWLASGQMASDQRDPVTLYAYTYDAAGRLETVSLNATQIAAYAYDTSERRVSKTVSAGTAHYIYDLSGRLLAEADGATGAVAKEYIWVDALPLGLVDYDPVTAGLYFIHPDHLARPQKITDDTQAIAWDGQFRPFGEAHAISASIVAQMMFPGQLYDPETQLHQNWHRDYDPSTGRYLQSDPIGLGGGINTYAYATGNPVVFADHDGRQASPIGRPGLPLPPIAQPGSRENREWVRWVEASFMAVFNDIVPPEPANDNETEICEVPTVPNDVCMNIPRQITIKTFPDDYSGNDARPGDSRIKCFYQCPSGNIYSRLFHTKYNCPTTQNEAYLMTPDPFR